MLRSFSIVLWISFCAGLVVHRRSEDLKVVSSMKNLAPPRGPTYKFQEDSPTDPNNSGATQSCKEFQFQPDEHTISAECPQNDQTMHKTTADLGLCLGIKPEVGFVLQERGNFFESCNKCSLTDDIDMYPLSEGSRLFGMRKKYHVQCVECSNPDGSEMIIKPRVELDKIFGNQDGHLKCLAFIGS